MKRRKYTIDWNNGPFLNGVSRGTAEVFGDPLVFPGYERFDLFVCKVPSGEYGVSEASTGMNASGGLHPGRLKAIAAATKNLTERCTPEKFAQMIAQVKRARDPWKLSGVIAAQRAARRRKRA